MYLMCIIFFATVSVIPSERIDVVFPEVETSRSGVKTIKFRALDQDVELNLEPAGEILKKSFGFVGENGKVYHPIDVENLRSKLFRNSSEGAALLIDEDGQLTIEGNINSNLRIAPHESGRMDEGGRIAHQIVEEIHEETSPLHYDVLPMNAEREVESRKRMSRNGECIVLEILSVIERTLTERFVPEEALTKHMTHTYMGVQNKIDTLELGIKVRLVGIEAFTKETEPSFFEETVIPGHDNYFSYLDIYSKSKDYYCKHDEGLAKDADIIMLSTERSLGTLGSDGEIETSVGGVASDSAVCDQCYKIGVAEHYNDYSYRTNIITHEAAHLIGVPHDGGRGNSDSPGALDCPSEDSYIMGDWGKNHDKFSECSKICAKYLLSLPKANCVYEQCKTDY
uniref:Metalloserrulase 9 n=1 Tax=Tityus serrulatus TaxID=6887 RepID=A0A076L339_TITSE|nr:metalloserrulase 9 [Tityus serrulatus]